MKAHIAAFVLVASIAATQAAAPDDMVEIPAGAFTMGSDTGPADERPAHPITLPPFRIDRFPVTNAQFAEFLNAVGTFSARGERLFDFDDADARIHRSGNQWAADKGFERLSALPLRSARRPRRPGGGAGARDPRRRARFTGRRDHHHPARA